MAEGAISFHVGIWNIFTEQQHMSEWDFTRIILISKMSCGEEEPDVSPTL